MNANPILLQKKYARLVELFAKKSGVSNQKALGIFYHSDLYELVSQGVSDMHCMSDEYLVQCLMEEWLPRVRDCRGGEAGTPKSPTAACCRHAQKKQNSPSNCKKS